MNDQPAGWLHGGGVAQARYAARVLIQSSSAAGKSSLMDAVLDLMPKKSIQYSAMTGQSLFYLGETDEHRILASPRKKACGRRPMRSSCCKAMAN
ncbi:hypothetical protein PWP93_27040 [Paraburkholderia sp. A1RI-2L]|uniref:hypothetical protein n=1 Tax=Paraburkholderia sp. A1RI-2L TaxID=3028367 RepID=UPI003B7D6074